MLPDNLDFNYRSIRSFTTYACRVDADTLEREVSFHVGLGPGTERHGDAFPVWEVPAGRMAWLSDWSFNAGGPLDVATSVGGSLGRVTREGRYVYVLNCAVNAGEMRIFSPARPVRYLAGEWMAVCFHHMGAPRDLFVRATFRLSEVPAPDEAMPTRYAHWETHDPAESFPGPEDTTPSVERPRLGFGSP